MIQCSSLPSIKEQKNYNHLSVDDPTEQDSIEEKRGIIMQCGNTMPHPEESEPLNNYPHHQKKLISNQTKRTVNFKIPTDLS